MLTHVLEDVSLQVPIDDKDSDSCDVFEGLLVGLDHLLHGFERDFRQQHLLHVFVNQLDLFEINALRTISA